MRLNKGQDEMMNNAIHNLGMIAEAKDVIGSPLTRQDMQRLARHAMETLGTLWDQIGQGQPTLGYAPCPWNEKHTVGLLNIPGQTAIGCLHTNCPMNRTSMSMEEWNRRE